MIQEAIEAASLDEVASGLHAKGFTTISIDEEKDTIDFSKLGITLINIFKFRKMKTRDLSIFFRQLSALFSAGVPLFDALVAMEEQFNDEKIRKIIIKIKDDVAGGNTFSGSLAKYPDVFSDLIVAMVAAGEKAGAMDSVLKRISTYLEKETQMQSKLHGALRYPIMVFSVLIIAFIFAVVAIIPKFSSVFSSFKTKLPLPTRILLWINYVAVHYWWLIIIIFCGGYFALRTYRKTPAGRLRFDQLTLKLPVFGMLITKISLARFFTMLSAMISSGIPIVDGLEITADTADNMVIANAISQIKEKVIGGVSLSDGMKDFPIFPPSSIHMVAIGEKSGSLENMLMKSAEYFNEETDYTIGNLMTLLEPFLIFFMALFVALLALGIFLPMWSVMQLYTH